MIAAAADLIADPDAKSVATLLIAMSCLALIAAFAAVIYFADRNRIRIDPYEHDFSNLPGFSRDQLERIARMPTPPRDEQSYPFVRAPIAPPWSFNSRTSPEVALRSKHAGTASPIPSGGAGVSQAGARRGS